jgi:hypothetical protein
MYRERGKYRSYRRLTYRVEFVVSRWVYGFYSGVLRDMYWGVLVCVGVGMGVWVGVGCLGVFVWACVSVCGCL